MKSVGGIARRRRRQTPRDPRNSLQIGLTQQELRTTEIVVSPVRVRGLAIHRSPAFIAGSRSRTKETQARLHVSARMPVCVIDDHRHGAGCPNDASGVAAADKPVQIAR